MIQIIIYIIIFVTGFILGIYTTYKYINHILKTNYPDTINMPFKERLKKLMDDLD